MAEMTDAQKRAAARKAKILARGNAGLQRLAQTARGDEAEKLYGGDETPSSSAPASRPETPNPTMTSFATSSAAPSATSSVPSSARNPGWSAPAPPPDSRPMSPDEEQMKAQFDAMMNMLGGGGGGPGGGAPPDMANLFASLMGGAGAAGGGPGLLGDGKEMDPNANPFAGMGMDPGQNPFAAMGMDPNANPFAGMMPPGMGMGAPKPLTKAQRAFPIIHAICVIALVVFVAAWWEPTLSIVRMGTKAGVASWAVRWSTLGGRIAPFAAKSVEPLPVFYAFLTLEAMLFATRVTLVQTPPSLHPLLANILPFLGPTIGQIVNTGSKYLGVASQVYADGALFIFGLGCCIILAEYLAK